MRYLKIFSILLVLGVFVSTLAQAREYANWIIPYSESEFGSILDKKFDSGELSVQNILYNYPELGENRQEIVDNLWEALSERRDVILTKELKSGGVYLDNSISGYEIIFVFDGGSLGKIHVTESSQY